MCVLAIAMALALTLPDPEPPPDRLLYDALFRLRTRTPSDRIVIVAIDAPSLKALGAWPWRRTVHAALIDRLSQGGAAAVGYDVLFSEAADPAGDAALAAALARSRRVVLPVVHLSPGDDGAPVKTERPQPTLAAAAAGLGHVDLTPDGDGGVRRLSEAVALNGDCLPGLTDALRRIADLSGAAKSGPCRDLAAASRGKPFLIGAAPALIAYAGSPGAFRTVSAGDVVSGAAPPGLFSGRIVLVGATAVGLGDAYPVPTSGAHGSMPGVEIMANALDASLADVRIARPAAFARAAFALFPLCALLAAFLRLRPRRLLLTTLGLAAGVVFASAGSFAAGTWLSPLPFLAAATLAWPLWSWRRLSAASEHIRAEIAHLGGTSAPHQGRSGDVIAAQLHDLSRARERAAAGIRRREEAMQHLSHDLRSPFASILAVLQGPSGASPPRARDVERHALRGLALADSYVQLARAEEFSFDSEPFDLNEAVLDGADELHPRAAAKGVVIETDLGGEDELLVGGDRALVTRALINLLDNAVKHSPHGAVVSVTTHEDGEGRAVCRVQDRGPGLAQADVDRLFEPFFRADGAAARTDGAGLGLAVVATVARRHGGSVRCDSRPGEGATMTLALPAWTGPS